MEKTLITKIKEMEGSCLVIGIDNDDIKNVIKTHDFTEIMFLENKKSTNKKPKKRLSKKHIIKGEKQTKSFIAKIFEFNGKEDANLKKLRKSFQKKKIDNLICNYKYIQKITKYFVRDSVYLTRGSIYIYGEKDELSDLENKYKRYTNKIENLEKGKKFLFIAYSGDSKNNKIQDIFYFIKDTFANLANFIANILIN